MRYEIKFILNSIEFDKFKTWLLINTGFVKKYEPRLVNSIYFDDLNNSSANDNLAGIGIREKYRLRWYNKDFSHLAKFEQSSEPASAAVLKYTESVVDKKKTALWSPR